jgi:tetratricopeptide (TPR) repeat protein
MRKFSPTFARLIESSLEELCANYASETLSNPAERCYAEALLAYLSGDLARLTRIRHQLTEAIETETSKDFDLMKQIVDLRSDIRLRTIKDLELEKLRLQLESSPFDPAWKGEGYFVLGLAYDLIANYQASQQSYLNSSRLLHKAGVAKKALKAEFNALVATSRQWPESMLIPQYHSLSRRALEHNETSLSGLCQLNISREYQKIGALGFAFKLAQSALDQLQKDIGTLPYYLALAHRAHLLSQLGRTNEARMDYEEARAAPFAEVHEALKWLKEPQAIVDTSHLTPTWCERIAEEEEAVALGDLEQRLLHLLGEGPKTTHDLVESLYGVELPIDSTLQRLKNLIYRTRRKLPGLIISFENKYVLNDVPHTPTESLRGAWS